MSELTLSKGETQAIKYPPAIFQTVSLRSTLAIWPYDAPHRVGITRSPLGLFACRGGRPTRKKSLDTKGVVFAGAL